LADALRAAGRPATVVALDGGIAAAIVVPIGGGSPGDPSFPARVHELTQQASRYGPTVAVSVDVPYPLAKVAPGCACLAVYGADPSALRAAAGVLAGSLHPEGHLPVTI
jgi:microcystin degradation protein MlrC